MHVCLVVPFRREVDGKYELRDELDVVVTLKGRKHSEPLVQLAYSIYSGKSQTPKLPTQNRSPFAFPRRLMGCTKPLSTLFCKAKRWRGKVLNTITPLRLAFGWIRTRGYYYLRPKKPTLVKPLPQSQHTLGIETQSNFRVNQAGRKKLRLFTKAKNWQNKYLPSIAR